MGGAELRVELGAWEAVRAEAAAIRTVVFVDEQRVPAELELDEHDAVSVHALAREPGGRAIGTGRLLPDGHIGRMAVLREGRGRGAGTALLLALMREARGRGLAEVVLNAQVTAVPFYERHGFRTEGQPYDDAGIEHITMRRRLDGIG
jgi:predicted GNAT family N-acyltransferase